MVRSICIASFVVNLVSFFVCGFAAAATLDQPIRYTPEQGATFVYDVVVDIERPDGKTTATGRVTYRAERVDDQQIRFLFGGRFDGRIYPNSHVAMTSLGKVESTGGDTGLPVLLGDLSELVLLRVADDDAEKWAWDDEIEISGSDSSKTLPFGRDDSKRGFSFRGRRREPEEVQPQAMIADEIVTYHVAETKGDRVTVKHEYLLQSGGGGGREFSIDGNGIWVFNRTDGMPERASFERIISIKQNDVTVEVPVDVSIKRVSAENIARLAAKTKATRDEVKRQRESPLSKEEKAQLVASLKSGDRSRAFQAINVLSTKSPDAPDADIVAAIDEAVRAGLSFDMARRAKIAYSSPEDVASIELNERYSRSGSVESTGLTIDANTKLFVGQIVQHRRSVRLDIWQPCRIEELKPNGNVVIARLRRTGRPTEVDRSMIQLAPEEVDQPNAPADSAETVAVVKRTWSDPTGTHKVVAELLAFSDGKAKLKRQDGKVVTIPAAKLSAADQKFLDDHAKRQSAKKTVPNPFE